MTQESGAARRYAAIMALLVWVVLVLQFYLAMENRIAAIPVAVFRFFSYFTILSNLMVALSYTAVSLNPSKGPLKPLARSSSLTAVAVYIVMVGIIYNTVLRSLSDLQGLGLLVDRMLHSIIPASFLLFWLLFVAKGELKWKNAFLWLWYPVAYILYVIVVGAFTGFYPYPFADASQLGYPKAILNGVGITAGFLALSLVFIVLAKSWNRRQGR